MGCWVPHFRAPDIHPGVVQLDLHLHCSHPTPLLLKHIRLKPVSDDDDVLRLVHGLLRPNPRSRLSATGALQSELIAVEDDEELDEAGAVDIRYWRGAR